jgi:hypothetical protein
MIRHNITRRNVNGSSDSIQSRWSFDALVYQITPNAVQAPDFPINLNDIPTGGSSIKTWNGLAYASIKTINSLAIASVKNVNGLA